MKSLIWKLVQRGFDYEIKQREDAFHAMKAKQRANDKVTINYPRMTKVILRTNDPSPLFVGYVTDYIRNDKGVIYALELTSDEGRVIMTLNTSPCYYHPAIEEALNKLEWFEQWNVLTGRGLCVIDPKEKEREEGYTFGGKKIGVEEEEVESNG